MKSHYRSSSAVRADSCSKLPSSMSLSRIICCNTLFWWCAVWPCSLSNMDELSWVEQSRMCGCSLSASTLKLIQPPDSALVLRPGSYLTLPRHIFIASHFIFPERFDFYYYFDKITHHLFVRGLHFFSCPVLIVQFFKKRSPIWTDFMQIYR